MNDELNKKKERQLDNLTNIVENHTRTERHLEQYSEIGSRANKENAREKQAVRENEIQNLKNNIINGNGESISDQINNINENYQSTNRYMENNFEKIPDDVWKNMEKKQENRMEQVENLTGKLDVD